MNLCARSIFVAVFGITIASNQCCFHQAAHADKGDFRSRLSKVILIKEISRINERDVEILRDDGSFQFVSPH